MHDFPANAQSYATKFDEISLNPGSAMQIQAKHANARASNEVKYIGFIKNQSLLVTQPPPDSDEFLLQNGQDFIVRGFNGIHSYQFDTQVLRTHAYPSSYLHFSWPRRVDCQLVRHSLRVAVALEANIALPDGQAVGVTMQDISVSGSMLGSPVALGALSERFNILFALELEGGAVHLNLAASIRNIRRETDGQRFKIGISFERVSPKDGLALHMFTNSLAQKSPLRVVS